MPFLSVVGACQPEWREADDDIMLHSQIIVDTKEGALKESGDIILSKVRPLAGKPLSRGSKHTENPTCS